MESTGERKGTSRRRIIEAASHRLRASGMGAAGLSGIMADSGLTTGAFYAHFDSKHDLVLESIGQALDDWERDVSWALDAGGIDTMLAEYLSEQHRDDPRAGCVSAALVVDIGRQPMDVRHLYTAKLGSCIDAIARHLPAQGEDPVRLAFSIFALALGSLQLSRAIDDPALSKSILDGGISAARRLAEPHVA
jgi:AcrR family transcriptional regulator